MKKQHLIGGSIVALAILALIVLSITSYGSDKTVPSITEKNGVKTYTEKDYGFTIDFPSDWIYEDRLSAESPCCVYIAHDLTSTTTAPNASGTPVVTVTKTEIIKIQIGSYDKRTLDPFSTTTSPIVLNGTTFYTGYMPNGQYFLLPRDAQTGLGAAVFRYTETPQSEIDMAERIVGSMRVATSTKK